MESTGNEKEESRIESPPKKKLRTQEPDIIVSVGSGSSKQEFECYKVILCYASEYFDTMLSLPLREAELSRIELPDKDPEEWKQFYEFIDPTTIMKAKITEQNALVLAPWFNEYQMKDLHDQCDEFVSSTLLNSPSIKSTKRYKKHDGWTKEKIEHILEIHSICEQCALEKSTGVALKEIAKVMTHGYDLLAKNSDVMEKVVNMFECHNSLMLSKLLSKDVGAIYTEITTEHEMDWSSSTFKAWVQSKLEYAALHSKLTLENAALKRKLESLPRRLYDSFNPNLKKSRDITKEKHLKNIREYAKSTLTELIKRP